MRMGILQADSVLEALRTDHRDYPHMFRDLFAGVAASGAVCFEDYDVAQGEFPTHVDACDAYVITGSRESVYEEHEEQHTHEDLVARWIVNFIAE